MERRNHRRFAVLIGLLAVLAAGLGYVALTDIVAPRGPRAEDVTRVDGNSTPDLAKHFPDGWPEGDGEASGETVPEDGADAEEDEGFPPLDRESKWVLTGEVLDHAGKPVEAKVHVAWVRVGRYPVGTVETDGKGTFHAFLPEPGTYGVTADRDGTRVTKMVAVEGEEASITVTLVFPGAASIAGMVKTEFGPLAPDVRGTEFVPGQEPLAVDLVPVEGGESLEALVDADGRYRISGAAAGEYFLRVRSKWFVTRVTLIDEEEQSFDIVLPTGRIHGRVTDAATGQAPEGVQVVIGWTSPGGVMTGDHEKAGFAGVSDRCSPDANGDYAFGNLPPGPYRIFSNGHWYNVVTAQTSLSEGNMEARIDFDLEKGSVVVLSVTDLEGKDVARPFAMTQGIRWGFAGHVSGLKAVTSEFIAGGDGYEFQRQTVDFRPGEKTPATFKLAPEAATRLVFVDPDGKPVAGVRVAVPWGDQDLQRLSAAFRRGSGRPFSKTDTEGAVWVHGLRAGTCAVKARMNGFAPVDVEVMLPETGGEVKLTLTPGDHTFDFRLVVVRVTPDGPAARAGVRPGDVIRAVDGKPVATPKELAAAIEAARAAGAETFKVTVQMGGLEPEVEFRVGPLGVFLEERFE